MRGIELANLPRRTREAYGPDMRFRVLGPLEVTGEHGPVPLGGPKQRAILANLILRANQVVAADTLIDQVWGDEPPESGRNVVQTYISHLRKALGPDRIDGRAPGYVLRIASDELDASRFERLLREARVANGSPGRAGSLLREALALWDGPAFDDLSYEPSLAAEIARLEELRLQALEGRVAADLAEGRHSEVIGELESLTRSFPIRERLWELLMLALYRSRRPADALAAFERARDGLSRELGVDPSPELRHMHERILREDPDLDLEGEPLRGYRLLEQVGEGAFGVVHRAIQPQVGRDVAIKAVHPELANHPDFVRRFEREAQIVARLEHPHIVPLYDYWREPDAAYLVMRFLRGGSVEDLLRSGPVEPSRVVSIVDQVASALGAAHRQGVVHRDVKPGNVLLDEEGNAYLTDFGVALDAGSPERSTGTMMRGTPAYLSPEQIRLDPAGPPSDMYALGIVAYEMLTGRHPFPDTSLTALLDRHLRDAIPPVRDVSPELPSSFDDAIGRATAKDPKERFAAVGEFAAAFRAALGGAIPVRTPVAAIRNPYKGLRAFLEADAADFFGREEVTERLVRRLGEEDPGARFLAVIGPSGSGKSSVVRAGLVPSLRRGALPGSERWYVIDLLPGTHPLREIESALLGIAVEPPPSLMEELERDDLGLARAVDRVLPDAEAELVIVLDQLEEIFTLVESDGERTRVLDGLQAAALQPGSRIRVVATLRADFYDAPLSVRGFGELLAARSEAITPMSPEELERAIVAPADRSGFVVEPRLVAEMLADIVDRPGALPLLQYALTELAEDAVDGVLSLDAYRRIGRVSGALARRAEQLFDPMDETSRHACRQMFLWLVTLGDGAEDTRRRVWRSELMTLADARAMEGVIDTFGRHRLLSFDRDPETREPTVEIAHEALLGAWSRLRDWIDEAREDLRTRIALAASAAGWEASGRDESFLLRGARLEQLTSWSETTNIALSASDDSFLHASVAQREAERKVERERREHEFRLERRSRTRLRALVAVLAAGLLVTASLTAVAVNRSREAERRRAESAINTLTSASVASLERDPEFSLLLALNAVDAVPVGDRVPAATVEALHWAIQEAGIAYPVADGPTTVVAGPLGRRGIIDLPLPQLVETARAHIRSLTPEECDRFEPFAVTCASVREPGQRDLDVQPVREQEPADPSQPLAGTRVTIFTAFDEAFGWPSDFSDELEAFTARTGIGVDTVNAFSDFEPWLRGRVAAGETPDLAFFPQPASIAAFAKEGRLMDLGAYVDADRLAADQSPYLVSLGTVGTDGAWPTTMGGLYGAFVDLSAKSLIYYPPRALRATRVDVPKTWEGMIALSDRLAAAGQAPWCVGFESATADGWPGTDLVENLLLRAAGPEAYDRWTFHETGFESTSVRKAFQRLGQILFGEGYLFGGTEGALRIPFWESQLPIVEQRPPGCWFNQGATWMAKLFPEGSDGRFGVFPFPTIDGRFDDAVLGAGTMVAAFADRPEVREVVRFLLSSDYGAKWAGRGHGWISANRRFDLENYASFERSQAELIVKALEADSFRFDASDLMPPEVGQDVFWDAMMRYATEGPESLDSILAELDAAWPDDG